MENTAKKEIFSLDKIKLYFSYGVTPNKEIIDVLVSALVDALYSIEKNKHGSEQDEQDVLMAVFLEMCSKIKVKNQFVYQE